MALMALTFGCITLTSCGDDGDGGTSGGGSGSSVNGVSIVGTWKFYFDSNDPSRGRVYDLITFNSNHTGSIIEEVGYGSDNPEAFTWTLNGNTVTVKWTKGSDDYDTFTIVQVIDNNTVTTYDGKKTMTAYRQDASSSDTGGNSGGDDSGTTTSSLVGAYNWSYTVSNELFVESVILNSDNTGVWTLYDHNGNIDSNGTFNWTQSGNKLNLNWTSNGNGAPNQVTVQSQSTTSMTINDGSKTFTCTKVSDGSNNTAYSQIVGTWRISSLMTQRYTNGSASGSMYVDLSEDRLYISEDGLIRYSEKGSSGYHFDGVSVFIIRNGKITMQTGSWLESITLHSLTNSEMDVEFMEAPEYKGTSYVQDWYRFMCYKM